LKILSNESQLIIIRRECYVVELTGVSQTGFGETWTSIEADILTQNVNSTIYSARAALEDTGW